MYAQTGGGTITTLAALNTALADLHPANGTATYPLTTAMFDQTNNPTAAEIDQAVANYQQRVYDYFQLDAEVAGINGELALLVADPAGYTMEVNAGVAAYVKTGAYNLDGQAMNLLISAAYDMGGARHGTDNAQGNTNGAHAYIHIYGDNLLYGFTDDGVHRGYACVTVVCTGDVNSGVHNFRI